MRYPPVMQFETRAREAEAYARLARERRGSRAPQRARDRWQGLIRWLPLSRPGARAAERALLTRSTLTGCEQ